MYCLELYCPFFLNQIKSCHIRISLYCGLSKHTVCGTCSLLQNSRPAVAVVARPEAAPEDANVATRSPPKSPRAADPGDIFMKLFKNITEYHYIIT